MSGEKHAIDISENFSECDDSSDESYIEEYIYPGLVLKMEYILLKKIGCGINAQVWLVYSIPSCIYLAMKLHVADYVDGCREVAIIKDIGKHHTETGKDTYCVEMLDYFGYEATDNAKYVCSVYRLYAGGLNRIINKGKHKYGLPIKIVKKLTRQILTALIILHEDLKIIHTDIKPENVLFEGIFDKHQEIIKLFNESDFDNKYRALSDKYRSDEEKFADELDILAMECVKDIHVKDMYVDNNEESYSEEDDDSFIEGDDNYETDSDEDSKSESESEDGINNEIASFNTRRQSNDDTIEILDYKEIHDLDDECDYEFDLILNNKEHTNDTTVVVDDKYIDNIKIAVTDFGNSYYHDKRTRNEIQDRSFRAPEIILDFNYSYACDIWSLGCLIVEMLTGIYLVNPDDKPLNTDIQHLYLLEKMFGPIPMGMKKKSKRSRFLFDKERNYHIKNVKEFQQFTLKNRLIQQFLFKEEEADEIWEFLSGIFEYNPHKRLTARQLLEHKWLQE
jgi:serine/threonine-protein kinase SRPK3